MVQKIYGTNFRWHHTAKTPDDLGWDMIQRYCQRCRITRGGYWPGMFASNELLNAHKF